MALELQLGESEELEEIAVLNIKSLPFFTNILHPLLQVLQGYELGGHFLVHHLFVLSDRQLLKWEEILESVALVEKFRHLGRLVPQPFERLQKLEATLHVVFHDHDGGSVVELAAVIGGTKDRDQVAIVEELKAVNNDLMRATN